MAREHTLQKVINILVYAFLITATVLSFSGKKNLADVFTSFET
jgi:preprotein translocase subunit SecG